MEYASNARRRKKAIKISNGVDFALYPHRLQLYTLPPVENITLQEFEDFAVERLKVLKAVETIGIRHLKTSTEYAENMEKELRNLNMKSLLRPKNVSADSEDIDLEKEFNERRKEHVSHFILRLAYSRSEDLKRWFLAQEIDLFKYRFTQETLGSVKEFLDVNNLNYSPIPDKEKNEMRQSLIDSTYDMTSSKLETTDYFKVPFTEVLDLVRGRKVFLNKGQAYVPRTELASVIQSVFRTNLSHSLAVTSRALPNLEEDERLIPMLSGLSKAYIGEDYSNKKTPTGVVTADMIDELSKKSFPLCMQQLHQGLKQNHHLKHGGRMQYGLFLKGIGLSLEEAMKFWRAEFSRNTGMDSDKFEKQYAYNIRHNYGKEGKRANYTPYSCMKIIMSNAPGPGDSHGCPFRHTDSNMLRQKLQGMKISKDGVDQVIDLVKGGHYQVACARYFELTHISEEQGLGINHPNQYFDESQRILKGGKREVQSVQIVGTPKTPRPSQGSQGQHSTQSAPKTDLKPQKLQDEFEDFPDDDLDSVMKDYVT
ncbi:DNA primase large subunit-like [Lineus longissimus]|uniref:DNA primase large subunit-like n=1 Tax=Lineus longissimus TaxID=88925 RepID=UPI002B4CCD6E